MELIDKDALVAEIERLYNQLREHPGTCGSNYILGFRQASRIIMDFCNSLEVKEVDLEKEAELIANGIMISVQSNKYGTNIYNAERNDFNHYHLRMAARKGIELGLKINQK